MFAVILFIVLLALTLLLYRLLDGNMAEPSLLFVGMLCVAVLNGLTNMSEWDYSLHLNTVFVIGFGSILFAAVCLATKMAMRGSHAASVRARKLTNNADTSSQGWEPLYIPAAIKIVALAFTVVSLYLVSRNVIALASQYGGNGTLSNSISVFDNMSKFSTINVGLSGIASPLFQIVSGLAYIWALIFVRELFNPAGKVDWLVLANLIASAVMPLLSGGRNGLFQLAVATAVFVMLFWMKRNHWRAIRLNLKTVLIVVCILAVVFLGFRPMLALLGRKSDTALSAYEYFSIYLGAPIKNLDNYLNGNMNPALAVTTTQWGDMTLASTRASFPSIFNVSTLDWLAWQPMQSYGTVNLGNVFTTFYAFIFDWGYGGAMVMVAVMAFISQLVFELAVRSVKSPKAGLSIALPLLGIVDYGCVFAFFSNRWVSTLFNKSLLYWVVLWVVCLFGLYLLKQRVGLKLSRALKKRLLV